MSRKWVGVGDKKPRQNSLADRCGPRQTRVYYSMGCRIGLLMSDIHDWFWLSKATFLSGFLNVMV